MLAQSPLLSLLLPLQNSLGAGTRECGKNTPKNEISPIHSDLLGPPFQKQRAFLRALSLCTQQAVPGFRLLLIPGQEIWEEKQKQNSLPIWWVLCCDVLPQCLLPLFFSPQVIVPCFLSKVVQVHSIRKIGWGIFTPS